MSEFTKTTKTAAPTTTPPAAESSTAATTTPPAAPKYRLPSTGTLQHVAKLAIVEDKPIMMDYWTISLDKKAVIGIRNNGEKLLVKSQEEYTSPIATFYNNAEEYIIVTENSIYVVASDIPRRKIN